MPRQHINLWLVAVVGLAAALVALGAWVLVDRNTSATVSATGPSQGLASPQVVRMLKNRLAAMDSGHAEAVAAFYTRTGVLEERDVTPAVVTKGREQIVRRVQVLQSYDMPLESESSVIQFGRYAAIKYPIGYLVI
jgi:hypothetical protein